MSEGQFPVGSSPATVFYLFKEQVASFTWPARMPARACGQSKSLVREGVWSGEPGQLEFLHTDGRDEGGHVLIVGLGPLADVSDRRVKAAGAAATKFLMARNIRIVLAALPERHHVEGSETEYIAILRGLMEGMIFAAHRLPDLSSRPQLQTLAIEFEGGEPFRRPIETISRAKAVGIGLARDLSMTPPNRLKPRQMADMAMALTRDRRVEAVIRGTKQLSEEGFGAILAVASGSAAEPVLVHLRYRPEDAINADKPVVLVGKSVTFDSGGVSLKPALDMDRMKADMAGGAAAVGALRAAIELDLPLAIDVLLPIVENMPGGNAMRPGDVIDTYSGKTVEVLNTDAEGRLILADALAFARTLNPDCVIDLATLTGASAIVFGPFGIGTFVNDIAVKELLFAADARAGERLWQLPLWPEYEALMDSSIADLANISSTVQKGSMMTAASFLHKFIAPVPWAHLDIYNSSWSEKDHAVFGKGATGAGVATLVEFLIAKVGRCN